MITSQMKLNSLSDARQWAADANLDDEQTDRLTAWVWANKPEPGCTYAEHPLCEMESDEFWAIVDPDEVE